MLMNVGDYAWAASYVGKILAVNEDDETYRIQFKGYAAETHAANKVFAFHILDCVKTFPPQGKKRLEKGMKIAKRELVSKRMAWGSRAGRDAPADLVSEYQLTRDLNFTDAEAIEEHDMRHQRRSENPKRKSNKRTRQRTNNTDNTEDEIEDGPSAPKQANHGTRPTTSTVPQNEGNAETLGTNGENSEESVVSRMFGVFWEAGKTVVSSIGFVAAKFTK